jgi:hypothetical protein
MYWYYHFFVPTPTPTPRGRIDSAMLTDFVTTNSQSTAKSNRKI